ncbi:MAG: hypothetical protein ACHQDD_03515 [Steroidobacterales bacterium]
MQPIRTPVLFGVATSLCSLAALATDAPGERSGAQSAPSAICQEAVVSPVSGYAECVKPRGAPVAPPPKRPDAVRAAGAVDTQHADKGH